MADDIQRETQTTVREGNTVQTTKEVSSPSENTDHATNVVGRFVWFIAGVLLVLLGFRFVLSLLGANTTNSFANFIYSASHPFVAPFFSLFNYKNYSYGVSHFEIYTLAAMAVYAIIAYGIVKLVTIFQK
jgi:hypothetical protein